MHVCLHCAVSELVFLILLKFFLLFKTAGNSQILLVEPFDMDMDIDYDTENAEKMNEPLMKTRKLAGATKYPSKFNPDWTKQWPCIQG